AAVACFSTRMIRRCLIEFAPPRQLRRSTARILHGGVMRCVRYAVAVSLDGYIAGSKGEADWIIVNPEIDFRAVFEQFDTFLVGRRTFETMARAGRGETPGMKTFVFSRTLRQQNYPGVTVVAEKAEEREAALRAAPGKGIGLFGGGSLFGSL